MNYGQMFMTLYRRQGARSFPKKKKCKTAKWLSEEALQIALKRREAKGKGEKERYTHFSPFPKPVFQSSPSQNPESWSTDM